MNRKISLGIIIILAAIYYLVREIYPELLKNFDYILNYKTALVLIGLVYIFRKQTFGWVLFLIGIYLLINDFLPNLTPIAFPIIMLLSGIILISTGIKENKKWR